MFLRTGLAAILILLLSSCSSLITGYLVNELLNNKAPIFTWRGTVVDSENRGIPDATVRVRGEVVDDPNPVDFSGLTDGTGHYQVGFKYNGKVSYRVSVLIDDVVVAERNVGSTSKGDQRDDFVVNAVSAQLEVSGVVNDANGDPLNDVLVLVGSASSIGQVTLFKAGADTAFDETSASGVFQLTGLANADVVAVAFHPDHGFAYATGEDIDSDGELALILTMGASGTHDVAVQVVDGLGAPVSNQVLDPTRQFRLRLSTPFDLGAEVDTVVDDNGLFPTLVGAPSDLHPVSKLLSVQSTGQGGFADDTLTAVGGSYQLDLLEIDSSSAATALVTTDNPLALGSDSTVVVRVN
ncbi:MAG: hypothetical protein M3R04_04720 [bacterium]|nr:hypothetical protein [bacterium]